MYEREIETRSVEETKKYQYDQLKNMIQRIYDNVPFYRKKMDEHQITPDDLHSLEDIQKFPFTVKQDLRDNYPFDLLAVPMEEIVRIHASSGTTGKPTVVCYTQKDIDSWASMAARSLVCAGGSPEDVLQNAYGYGLFTGGLGIHNGAETLGTAVIPISGGNTNKQLMLMKDLQTSILTCTPSYALYLADAIHRKEDLSLEDLNLKIGVFGGEPWTNEMRQEIENKLHIKAYDIYGLSEIYGPGVGIECECQEGLHIWEDHFIVEIVNPETLMPVPEGEEGELVITTFTKEGMPLLRYRTRDLTRIIPERCSCGRTHKRIDRLKGRTDDMLIIRGVNVFPSQIESALLQIPEIACHYQIIVDRIRNLDTIEIKVELDSHLEIDDLDDLKIIEKKTDTIVHSVTGIHAKITLVEPHSLERTSGKSKRVLDLR